MNCQVHIDPSTDVHCHILPGLDDGAQTLEDSVALARRLAGFGFRKAVCTTHRNARFPNMPIDVMEACRVLREELDRLGIDLELVPSMEYRLVPQTWPETLEKGWLLPWEGRHILVELPIHNPAKMGDLVPEDEIAALIRNGFQPVLAHPERYLYLDMDRYRSLKEAGALFQRNIGSLEGLYGVSVIHRAEMLDGEGFYDLVGTDLHNQRYADFFDSFGFRTR